jgi:hypothetical protein
MIPHKTRGDRHMREERGAILAFVTLSLIPEQKRRIEYLCNDVSSFLSHLQASLSFSIHCTPSVSM